MAIDQLNVELNLDSKEFADGLKSAISLIKKLDGAIEQTDDSINRNRSVIRAWGKGLRGSLTEVYSLQQLLLPIANGIRDLSTGFIRANASLEKTTAVLAALNSESGKTSSEMIKTTKAIEDLNQMALNTPFTIESIQNAMVKLTAGGVTDLDYAMNALTDSVAIFGGGAAELDRASIAIQQMAGKGVVSMEELRQQLGEAVPTAMQMMADGLGMTMGDLANLVESGTLEATGALDAMFTQMTLSTGGAAQDMMTTWDGLISQFQTQLVILARELGGGDGGLFDTLKQQLSDIVDLMTTPEAEMWARDLGESLKDVVLLTRDLVDNFDTVLPVLRGIAAFWAARFAGKMLVDLAMMAKSTLAWSKNIITTAGSVRTLSAGLTVLRRSFASLLGPIGLMISIAYDLVNAFGLFSDEIDEIKEKAGGGVLSGEEFTTLESDVIGARKEIERLSRSLELQKAIIDSQGLGSSAGNRAGARTAQLSEEIWALRSQIADGERILQTQADLIGNAAATRFERDYRSLFRAASRSLQNSYNSSVAELKKIREENPLGLSPQEVKKQYAMQKSALDEAQALQLADAQRFEAKRVYEMQKTEIEGQKISDTAKKAALDGLRERYDQELVEITSGESRNLEQIRKLRDSGIDTISKTDDFWDKAYQKSFIELSGWLAKANGENVNYAKAVAKSTLEARNNKDATQAQAEAMGMQVQKVRELISSGNEYEQVQGRAQTATENLSRKLKEQESPYTAILFSLDQYKSEIQAIASQQATFETSTGQIVDVTKQQAAAVQALTEQYRAQGVADLSASTNQIKAQIKEIEKQTMSAEELSKAEDEASKKRITQLKAAAQEMRNYASTVKDPELKAALKENAEQLEKLAGITEKNLNKFKTPMQEMMHEWSKLADNMTSVWTNAMDGFADSLANFVMTGKLDFNSLANSIMADILRVTIRAGISNIFGDYLGTALGGGTDTGTGGTTTPMANGGVMTSGGSMSLKRYARGGVAKANNPQLAMFGEGSQNEAFVPLPDGRSIPVSMGGQQAPNVSVNVINETGQQATAEQQGGPKFDGERWVLDVVMKAMNRPGNFRSAIKGNTRQ